METVMDLFDIQLDGQHICIKKYKGNDVVAIVPETIGGMPVGAIGASAFQNCTSLTHVILGKNVREIDEMAFMGCTSLRSISLDDLTGVTIGDAAFKDCTSLTQMHLGKNVAKIGWEAFMGCTALRSVTLGENPNVSVLAFKGCTSLADANGYVVVGNTLYDYIGNANHIVVPKGVTTISWDVFKNRTNITRVTLPPETTTFESDTFKGCTGLADSHGLVILNGVLFDYFGNSRELTLPQGIIKIADCAFDGHPLRRIVLQEGIREIGMYAFWHCNFLQEIILPETLTTIEIGAFDECCDLRNIHIPNSVTEIGSNAFYDCTSLTEITIPAGVKKIDYDTFRKCVNLRHITYNRNLTFDKNAFEGCPLKEKIFKKV